LLVRVWIERPHTVLFVTHELREAIMLADRLMFLSPPPARIVAEIGVDIPRGARDQEAVIEDFRGRLIANFPVLGPLL